MSPQGPAYRVLTPRLLLRCCELTDAPQRLEAMDSSGAHLAGYRPVAQAGGPSGVDLHLALLRRYRAGFDSDQDRVYVAFEAGSGRLIGEVSLLQRAGLGAKEVGYWLRADATRQGYATEMAAAAVRLAFELEPVKRVDLMIDPDNHASIAVAERLHFKLEGRLRDRQLAPHHPRGDLLSFSLLRDEYAASPAFQVSLQASDALGRALL